MGKNGYHMTAGKNQTSCRYGKTQKDSILYLLHVRKNKNSRKFISLTKVLSMHLAKPSSPSDCMRLDFMTFLLVGYPGTRPVTSRTKQDINGTTFLVIRGQSFQLSSNQME